MKIIEASNLYKVYGNGLSSVEALKDINLQIEKGETTAIIGASGSGKSTLLNILSGLDQPTTGEVLYKERNISNANRNELAKFRSSNIGFVFQFFNLVSLLTVEENILLPVLINGKKPDKKYISLLVDSLGIKNKLNTSISKLSGGEQQRVAIARALSNKPSILFADEPTGNLDSKTSRDIINVFKDTAEEFQQTMVVVTHDINVASFTTRQIEIEDGQIISDGLRG